jgi:RNA polymerase sigma-70 factor, ECF subfamily
MAARLFEGDCDKVTRQDDAVSAELPVLLPRLWRFAMRLTSSTHEAQDLVQHCCVRALERRTQWRQGSSMLSWLFAIMHSIWLNELRSRHRRHALHVAADDEAEEMEAPPGVADPEQWVHLSQVFSVVQGLPEMHRTVLILVAVEGLSYQEAAEVLGVPIGTVMSRLARARIQVGRRFVAR